MPPRIPSRVISSIPFASGPVASSSSLTLPPRPPSPRRQKRNLSTASRACPSRTSTSSPLGSGASRSFHSSASAAASAKDPYDVLGVKKEASNSEIKKSYYQLAKKWHPDSNKDTGAKERFMEIQTAYDILSDDSKRQAYDRYGSASTQEGFDPANGAGGFGGFQGFGSSFGGRAGNAGDLFESLFGGSFGGGNANPFAQGGGGRQRAARGDDLEAAITLSFLEACNGSKRKIVITPVVDCKPCNASGLKAGQKKTQCSTCRGTGQQTFQVQGMFMASTCQTCGGAGTSIPRGARCGECEGVGRVKERKEVEVDIPPGVEDGMKVKIPGSGDMPLSTTGPPGDLFVRVNVRSSPVFRRQGTNLYHDAKVQLHTALLGGKVRIPTLEGDVEVRVREGTQNGEEAVLKGRGVKSVYGGRDRGDLVVGWRVQIPRSLSTFQKKILQAFADDYEGRTANISFGTATPQPTASPATPPPTRSQEETPNPSTPRSASQTQGVSGVDGVPQEEKVAEGDIMGKPAEQAEVKEAAVEEATDELAETEEEVEEEKKRATG